MRTPVFSKLDVLEGERCYAVNGIACVVGLLPIESDDRALLMMSLDLDSSGRYYPDSSAFRASHA